MSCHKYIKRVRERYELTQAELAEYLRVHPQSIYRWERGAGCPRGGDRVTLWLLGDEVIGSRVFRRLRFGLQQAGLIDALD